MSRRRIRTVPYWGGKSALNHGSGRWVASMLPPDTDVAYCEPCCGFCGILVQRPRADIEIVNDINDRIANFLSVCRDEPDALAWRVEYTPRSESDFHRAVAGVDTHPDAIERARMLYVVVSQSLLHGDGRPTFGLNWGVNRGRLNGLRYDDILDMADRLVNVQILCRDGVDVLDRMADIPTSITYVDPPYHSAETGPYRHADMDWERMGEVLRECKGRVAISGYGDEWDSLGWQRSEFHTTFTPSIEGMTSHERTEVLWTNYEPAQRRLSI